MAYWGENCTFGTSVTLGTTSGTYIPTVLSHYQEGTFTATATGMTASVTGTAYFVRVGNSVTIYLPELDGTSNATSFTVTGLPASLIPARAASMCSGFGRDNGTDLTTSVGISVAITTGIINLYKNAAFSAWTNSGNKVLYATTINYQLK